MNAVRFQRSLMRLAFAAGNVYAWLGVFAYFLYKTSSIGAALATTMVLYALSQALVVVLTPVAAHNLRHGMRQPLTLATLSAAAAFATLGLGFMMGDDAVGRAVGIFAILMGVYRAFYFVPYRVAVQGVSRTVPFEVILALMPAIAGYALAHAPAMPSALYLSVAGVITASTLSLLWLPEGHEGFSWGYRETFQQLFDPRHTRLFVSSVSSGVEAAVFMLLWPLAIWLLVGRYVSILGMVLSLSFLLTLLARAFFARFKWQPTPTQEILVVAAAWIMRSLAGTAAAVITIDVYSGTASQPHARGLDSAAFEHAADNHAYVDEYTTLKEMGNALGRVLLALFVATVAIFSSFYVATITAFIVAGVFACISIYFSRALSRSAF